MRRPPSLSLRSIIAVALLLGGGLAGASSCARQAPPPVAPTVPLDEAVRRTIAAGSARIRAQIRQRPGAAIIVVEGVTSLRTRTSTLVATRPGSDPVEVRTIDDGTWLRTGPREPWIALEPGVVDVAGAVRGWDDLLHRLEPVGRANDRTLRATHDGAPATVLLDGAGRIRRLRILGRDGELDLRFSDHGLPVEVSRP